MTLAGMGDRLSSTLRNQCQTRKGIAAYSLEGVLDPDWNPMYAGKYSLVWALHVDGASLHTGGEFLTVSGVTQNYYTRLSLQGSSRQQAPSVPRRPKRWMRMR
jgi:hypothetical protein